MQSGKTERPAFAFAAIDYFHRYTVNDQHEFTPAGQEDLERWTDIVTLHYYRKISPEFIEAVFARFRLHDGIGTAVIYSHRVYGNKVGDEMSAWLGKNGVTTEKALIEWNAMPAKPPVKP